MGPGDFQTLAHGFVNRAREMGPALSAKLALSVFDGIMTFLMTLFLLFLRFLPMISMTEVKGMIAADRAHAGEHS